MSCVRSPTSTGVANESRHARHECVRLLDAPHPWCRSGVAGFKVVGAIALGDVGRLAHELLELFANRLQLLFSQNIRHEQVALRSIERYFVRVKMHADTIPSPHHQVECEFYLMNYLPAICSGVSFVHQVRKFSSESFSRYVPTCAQWTNKPLNRR